MKKQLTREEILNKWLIFKLRRLSLQWPERYEAIKRVKIKVEIGTFKNGKTKYKVMGFCQHCGWITDLKDIEIDHIKEVIPLQGFVNLQEYINSLFCSVDNLQALCSGCHQIKTNKNREKRNKLKKKLAKK